MPEPVDYAGTPLVAIDKAAELLKLPEDDLRRDIHAGRMPAIKFGKSWFVRRAWIDRTLAGVRLAPSTDRSGIYIAGFGPYVKIGVTLDVDQRFSQLQTPEPMTIYGLLQGGLNEELALHRRFAAYRLNGEWFRREGDLAQWIEGGCND